MKQKKEELAANALDLLDDYNFHLMIKIFEYERDPDMVEKVIAARQSQIEYIEFTRRCGLAKHNLFPRSNHLINASLSPQSQSPRQKVKGVFGK